MWAVHRKFKELTGTVLVVNEDGRLDETIEIKKIEVTYTVEDREAGLGFTGGGVGSNKSSFMVFRCKDVAAEACFKVQEGAKHERKNNG